MHGLPWWFGYLLDSRFWAALLVVILFTAYTAVRSYKKKKKRSKSTTNIPTIVLAPSITDTKRVG